MPTFITTEANAQNQEPTKSAHIAQNSGKLNQVKTMKSDMGKLISVQKVQVDGKKESICNRLTFTLFLNFQLP